MTILYGRWGGIKQLGGLARLPLTPSQPSRPRRRHKPAAAAAEALQRVLSIFTTVRSSRGAGPPRASPGVPPRAELYGEDVCVLRQR